MHRALLIALVLSLSAAAGSAQTIFFEDFSNLPFNGTTTVPAGWTNVAADSGDDWIGRNSGTSSAGTGPPADHTSGVAGGTNFYMYVEDSGSEQTSIELESPQVDLGPLVNPVLRFCVHSRDANGGSTENMLTVDVENVTTGMTTPDVVTVGHLGDDWEIVVVDLTQFAGDTVCFVFRGRTDNGTFTHDIAIDDVEVREAVLFDIGFFDSILDTPMNAEQCGQQLGNAESVTFTIVNNADVAIPAGTTIHVTFTVDNGTPVNDSFALLSELPPSDSVAGFLSGAFDFEPIDDTDTTREVEVLVDVTGFLDENPSDNTLNQTLTINVPDFVQSGFSEHFNSVDVGAGTSFQLPGCFMQVDENPGGSSLDVKVTDSASTFLPGTFPPGGDASTPGGNYLFGDSTSVSGVTVPVAAFRTPKIEVPSNGDRLKIGFKVWSNDLTNGQVGNTLSFNVLDGDTDLILFQDVYSVGNLGHDWFDRAFAVPQTSAQTVRIEGVFDLSGGAGHSLALDDFFVDDFTPLLGQSGSDDARLIGFNDEGQIAQDAEGLDPFSDTAGPFTVAIDSGGNLVLEAQGTPNSPFARLLGTVNVGNIPIPGVGQIDLGNGFNDLAVIGDGNQPGVFNSFFNTGPTGDTDFVIPIPPSLAGTSFGIQDVVFPSGLLPSISNVIEGD